MRDRNLGVGWNHISYFVFIFFSFLIPPSLTIISPGYFRRLRVWQQHLWHHHLRHCPVSAASVLSNFITKLKFFLQRMLKFQGLFLFLRGCWTHKQMTNDILKSVCCRLSCKFTALYSSCLGQKYTVRFFYFLYKLF